MDIQFCPLEIEQLSKFRAHVQIFVSCTHGMPSRTLDPELRQQLKSSRKREVGCEQFDSFQVAATAQGVLNLLIGRHTKVP